VPDKPLTIDAYKNWLKEAHGVEVTPATEKHYEVAANHMKEQFAVSPFWNALVTENKLRDYDADYRIARNDYPLLLAHDAPKLLVKSFDSFLEKTFRINVLQNGKWPNSPRWLGREDWLLPGNWFGRVNDIVRTCWVVKYFDGVAFLADRLRELAENHQLDLRVSFQSRDEGYYAAHLNVDYQFDLLTASWEMERVSCNVELQITTQLQDVIRQMTHKQYEQKRVRSTPPDDKWKWDYKSSEFTTNYLGHILHFLEGMIVEIRDRKKENE
jgi:hypothetical protein